MRASNTLHLSFALAMAGVAAFGCASKIGPREQPTPTGVLPGATTSTTGAVAPTGAGGGAAAATTTTGAVDGSTTTTGGTVTPDPTLDITNDPSLADPLPADGAGPLELRRLSPREYTNTLRDLVGDTVDSGADLPDEANRESGFAVYESASLPAVTAFMETAERLLADGRIQVPACTAGSPEATCAQNFIDDFGRRAFRRPVTSSERENLLALFDTARGLGFDYGEAVGHVATAMLQSSGFLYLWEVGDAAPVANGNLIELTPYQIASRLSYLLWGTMPDDQLAQAADSGQLSTPEQIATHTQRLLADSAKLEGMLADFHLQWLHLDNLDDLQKDTTLYPQFNDEVRSAFKTELLDFASDVFINGDATVRSFFGANYTVYTNDAVAGIYGVAAQPDSQGHLALNGAERSGFFTLTGYLAATSNTSASNPARRGKLMWESVLCGSVPPPPANVPPVEPPSETTTTRQRFETHSENPCASGCHNLFDPLGFAFENYDAIGAYRTEENGLPVDASGTLVTPAGGVVPFTNAIELLTALAGAYEVDRCVADHWFNFMQGREMVEGERASFETAYRAAGAGPNTEFSVRDFIVQALQTTAFRMRTASE